MQNVFDNKLFLPEASGRPEVMEFIVIVVENTKINVRNYL